MVQLVLWQFCVVETVIGLSLWLYVRLKEIVGLMFGWTGGVGGVVWLG